MQRDPYNLSASRNTAERLNTVRTQVVLWLIVLALGVALIPLTILSRWVRDDSARLQQEIHDAQTQIEQLHIPSEAVEQLNQSADANEALIAALQAASVPVGVDWPRTVAALADYDPILVRVASLNQRETLIRITGRALNNDAVIRYQQRLQESGAFESVVVLSLVALPTPAEAVDQAPASFGSVDFEIDAVVRTAPSTQGSTP